jgi:hypothetical protein
MALLTRHNSPIDTTVQDTTARFDSSNIVVALFIAAAAAVVILRSLSALMMNTDPSIQIGAALNLLNGDGLGTYALNDDITQLPKLTPLTWFPPGFSIAIVLLAKVGFSTAVALKFIYSVSSIAGWLGWGLIFRDVMRSQVQTAFSKIIAIVLAIFLPLYFTYDWVGTDLILWAIIPFVIRLLYQPASRKVGFWIGGLVGLAYTVRFAAIFLIAGIALFFLVRRRGWKTFGQILVGFSIPYAATALYRMSVKTSIPHQLSFDHLFEMNVLLRKMWQILEGLGQVRFLFFGHLNSLSGGKILGFVTVCVLLSYGSILVWRRARAENSRLDIILSLCFGLILFLIAISFVSSVDFVYLADHRYYYPLFPSMAVVAYELGFQTYQNRSIRDRALKFISLFFLGALILATTALFLRSPEKVFGFDRFSQTALVEYPSNEIVNKHPESYQQVKQLLEQNPSAIAITFAEDFDIYHSADTSIRQRLLPAAVFTTRFFSKHTVGQDIQAYLIFGKDHPDCKSYCYYESAIEVELMQKIRSPKLVYQNAGERLSVFSATLPKGFQFTLDK